MNPYTLIFGKEPAQMIARHMQTAEIIDTFNSDNPSQQVYIITGVRGAGKTVLMTDVAKRLQKNDIWITVELNPERDMLETLVSKLSSNHTLAKLFQSAKINLSLFGFGLEVSGEAPVSDLEIALGDMDPVRICFSDQIILLCAFLWNKNGFVFFQTLRDFL